MSRDKFKYISFGIVSNVIYKKFNMLEILRGVDGECKDDLLIASRNLLH